MVRSTAQEGVDYARTDGAAVQGEVHAAGKYRVNKGERVSDHQVSLASHGLSAVREIGRRIRRRQWSGPFHSFGDRRRLTQRVQEKLIEGRPAGFDVVGMADHAHAHGSVFEGNEPAPAVVEPAGGDIALIHPDEPGDAFKMAEHGSAAMFLAPVLSTHLTGQKRVAAACIDHESGLPCAWTSLSILRMDQRGPSGLKLNAVGLGALVEVDAFGDRILGENVIEFGALDLKGVGLSFIKGLGEMEHL